MKTQFKYKEYRFIPSTMVKLNRKEYVHWNIFDEKTCAIVGSVYCKKRDSKEIVLLRSKRLIGD